jgi:uncharacterized membrane protein YedE/YeeE
VAPLLPYRVPWYIVGPLMGLTVVALYALANERLGATGAYFQFAQVVRRAPNRETWRAWFFVGLFAGALVAALLRGGSWEPLRYGALGLLLPLAALVPILFVAGVLMGFGARWAGGCTSGNGLSGTAMFSPAALASTATFFGTAIVVSFVIEALI